jgi:hypothetical protein
MFAGEEVDAGRALRREPGEHGPIGAGQALARRDPAGGVAARLARDRSAEEKRVVDRIDRVRQTVDVHERHAAAYFVSGMSVTFT